MLGLVLMPLSEDDPDGRAGSMAFTQALAQRGSPSGSKVRVDFRCAIDNADKVKAMIAELQAHPPDVIVASTSQTVAALLRTTLTVPLVFAMIYEPVAQGFVQSLAHPGGNATGLTRKRLRSL
jgi:putative tryptophan/tyrosine transport system substrate-binding protein